MSTHRDYRAIHTGTKAGLNWLSVLGLELKKMVTARSNDLLKTVISFLKDFQSAENWQHKIAAVIAIVAVGWFTLYLPVSSIGHWLYWEIREVSISYQEFPIPIPSEIESGVNVFANEYSQSFGSNCEWFRKHDVDIAMYEKYKRLRNPNYECDFTSGNRVKIYALRVGDIKQDGVFNTIEVLLGRLEYNDSKAVRYSSIRTKLWQLSNEGANTWRIDKMKIEQKVDLSS